jgi:long-chain fatty acid transport protein
MKKFISSIWAMGMIFCMASTIYAGGFGITEKGVKGQGSAFSGNAASAEDASTIYWNPAGMTRLENSQMDLALFSVTAKFKFQDESATDVLGQPIQPVGANGGDAGFTAAVPNFFFSHKINDNWSAGLGIVVPFGLGTEYDSNWVGRYHTIKSQITTYDINPSVAYRFNSQWSVGGGISFQYLDAELTKAVDYGLLTTLNPKLGAMFPGLTPSSVSSDGLSKVKGDSWGYGFNLGVLFEWSAKTRFGLSYRSMIRQKVEDTLEFNDPATAPGISQAAFGGNQNAKATIDFPSSASLSGFHMINEKWAVKGDITWTEWSTLDELRITSEGDAPDSVTTLNWDDTWRLSAGVDWYYSSAWTWRTGIAYDPTPIPNAENRTPRVPDADRFWFALGGTWKFAPAWSLDLAGTYIWALHQPELNKMTPPLPAMNENTSRGNLKGTYDAYSIVIGAQINFTF